MSNISKTGIVTSTGYSNANLATRYVSPGGGAPGSTTAAGRTQYYGDYGIIIPAETSADTYFRLFFKEELTQNTVYTLSCYAQGLITDTYYRFPLFAQANSSMGLLSIDHNGLCTITFTMTYTGTITSYSIDGGTVYTCLMDDINRNIASGQGPITLTQFKLEKGSVPTPWVPCSTDPLFLSQSDGLFEIDDICKIHKIGCIQAYEFIET